jgi:type II secretory pathway component HofQ
MEKALGEKAKRIIAEGHMLDENSSSAARPPYTLYNEHLSAEEDPLRQIVDLSFREMPLKDVVKILEDLGEIKIVTDLPLDGIVTVNLQDVPLGRGMEAIIRMQGLGIVEEDVGFRITTWDEAVETRRETRMISLGHANAGEIAALLKDVLTEATDLGAIRIAANETRNVVILSGPSELVEEFADLIQELDTANPVILTATQVITLDHSVNAEDMIRAATKLLSDVGTVSYDLRSHQLIFTDLPVNIAEIRAKVDDATRRAVKEQRKGGEPSSQSSDAESNSLNAQEAPSTLFNAHLSAEDDPLRQVVDLEFKEMPLENIVQILEDLGQVKIVTGLPLDAIVSANLEEIPLGRAMETIFRMQGLGFVREDDGFRITTWDEAVKARRERIEGKTEERAIPPYKVAIQVKYAKEADLVPAVTLVLSESGTVKFDARSGHLLVTDTPAKVEEIRALVESLDVIDDIEQYEKTQTLNRELKRLKAEEKAIREQLSDLERLESEPRKGE